MSKSLGTERETPSVINTKTANIVFCIDSLTVFYNWSGYFHCFDSAVLGLSIGANMQATLCVDKLDKSMMAYPDLKGVIIHSDRGSQYTSQIYRDTIAKYNVIQSMNSDGGRCHDNARCESMLARMKSELFYGCYDTRNLTKDELKIKIWRYFMSYWNNRRIC